MRSKGGRTRSSGDDRGSPLFVHLWERGFFSESENTHFQLGMVKLWVVDHGQRGIHIYITRASFDDDVEREVDISSLLPLYQRYDKASEE